MTTPKEVEIKLRVAPASVSKLATIPVVRALKAKAQKKSEVSVYFDTDGHKLRKRGLTLRVRSTGDRYVQTIKAAANGRLFERDEWEWELPSEVPDLDLARGTALEPILDSKLRRRLKPVFETRIERTVYPLTNGAHSIELALDQGRIDTGERSMPVCEIELELERGKEAELFDVARELTQGLSAQLALKSKSERGYELLDGKQDAAVKAGPVNVAAGMSTRDGFQVIGRACLKQIIENEPGLLKGDGEGVHQMRVGLRRLRAAMSLFGVILRGRETARIKTKLKWLTGELGPARELDVLLQRVVAPVADRRTRWDGVPALSRDLADRREAALQRAQHAVRSARFRDLTLDVAAWLEAGEWTHPSDDLVRERGDLPVEVSAAAELDRRWKKIRKRGRKLTRLGVRRRHKLRIEAKKVRYAVEFFAGAFPGQRTARRREKLLHALEELQDTLGDLNDIAVHEEMIAALGVRRRRASRKRAFAAGLLAGREDARLDIAMADATAAAAKLAGVKPFWR
jgi:triphosphatase